MLKSKTLFFAALVFLVLIHLPYLLNGFIWLDHNDIEQKLAVLPLNYIFKSFIVPFGQTGFYRPVVTIIDSIDYSLYGNWAPGYHLTNLIIFGLLILAAYNFVGLYFNIEKKLLSLFIFLIAVHPIGILIKAAITFRQESLLLLFVLLCLYYYKIALRSDNIWHKAAFLLFFALALFTKETGIIILPFILIINNESYSFSISKSEITKILTSLRNKYNFVLVGLPITIVVYAVLRRIAVPGLWNTHYPVLTASENVGLRIGLFKDMLLDLVSPFKPSLSDAVPVLGVSSPTVLVTMFTVGGIAFYALWINKDLDIKRAFTMLILTLVPGLDLIPVPRPGSPHYSFLALVPFSILLLKTIQLQKNLLRNISLLIIYVWISLSTISTFNSGSVFKDDLTLFKNETKKDNNFSEAYYYLGNYFLKKGEFTKAAENYSEALKERPDYIYFENRTVAELNLGTAYLQLGKSFEAEKLYESVLLTSEESLRPYVLFNLALISDNKGEYNKVVDLLQGRDWDFPEAYLLLSKAYHELGNYDKESETIKKAGL